MNSMLYFLLGFIIGGFIMLVIMCCIQINRINEFDKNSKIINRN